MSNENNIVKMAFIADKDGHNHLVYNVDGLYFCPSLERKKSDAFWSSRILWPFLPKQLESYPEDKGETIIWTDVHDPHLAKELDDRRILAYRASERFTVHKPYAQGYKVTSLSQLQESNAILEIDAYYSEWGLNSVPIVKAVWDKERDVLKAINWHRDKESLVGSVVVRYLRRDLVNNPRQGTYNITDEVGVVCRSDSGQCYLKQFEYKLDIGDYVPELK